jgi:hypothetical protein
MSDEQHLVGRILRLVERLCDRIDHLEAAQREAAELRLKLVELETQQEIDRREQSEINEALAGELGGVLVKVEPLPERPQLRVVVDNDRPHQGDQ